MGSECSTDSTIEGLGKSVEFKKHLNSNYTNDLYKLSTNETDSEWMPVGMGTREAGRGFLGTKKVCRKDVTLTKVKPYLTDKNVIVLTYDRWVPNRILSINEAKFDNPSDKPEQDVCDASTKNCGNDPKYYTQYSNVKSKVGSTYDTHLITKTPKTTYIEPTLKVWSRKGTQRGLQGETDPYTCFEMTPNDAVINSKLTPKNGGSPVEVENILGSNIPLPFDPNTKKSFVVNDSDKANRDQNFYVPTAQYNLQSGLLNGVYLPAGLDRPKDSNYTNDVAHVANSIATITTFELEDDIFGFNDNVFGNWLNLLLSEENVQAFIDDAREIINSCPELVMLNAVHKYVNKFCENYTQSMTFVEIPIGPPLIQVDSSMIPKKYFMPSVDFKNIDTNMPSYNPSYPSPVIMSISQGTKDYEPQNFLDETFTEVVKSCRLEGILHNQSDVIVSTIPSKGYQIFEVISQNQVAGLPVMTTGYKDLVYPTTQGGIFKEDTTYINLKNKISINSSYQMLDGDGTNRVLPRFVMSFSPLQDILTPTYDDLSKEIGGGINVPIMKIEHNEDKTITFEINTLSKDTDNVVYCYVPKVEFSDGDYMPSSTNGNTIDGISTKMINLSYKTDGDGIPSLLWVHEV